jgi:catalase
VLYDAVALMVSEEGAAMLAVDKPAKDFINDAFAHCKFIGHTAAALPLIQRAGVLAEDMDEGVIALAKKGDAAKFIETCGQLRLWERELKIDLDAVDFLAAQKAKSGPA